MKRRQAKFGWGLTPWVVGLALCVGCTHVDHHGKCPPAGDCVGYPSGLCAGYYPTCWRMWPAECPSCPVEPAPVAVPGPGAPAIPPSDEFPGDDYLTPEGGAPPATTPQTSPPAAPQLPPTPRAAGRRPQPIRSRPVPRVEDSTSVGPPPRPMAAATVRTEARRPDLAGVAADLPAVRVVSEVRPLPPVQDAPAVRQANRIRVAPVEWGQLIAELPSAKVAEPRPPQPAAPIAPLVVPTGPAVRPAQRQAAPPGSAPQPAVRAAQPIRR